MKIIVGLGNPGDSYKNTRHNAGFLGLDFLHNEFNGTPWQEKKKLLCLVSECIIHGKKILLAKPTTFMNDSGQAVKKLLEFYKLTPDSLLVIHDDIDILAGTIRHTTSSRAAGHNGVADIITHLNTQDFKRTRLGIGRPTEVLGVCQPSHDYVLGKFTKEELHTLNKLFDECLKDEILSSLFDS